MNVLARSLLLFIKILVSILIGAFALLHTPNLANFPYLDKITLNNLPQWIYSWANFDGVHYVGIAMQGYHEFDQAFFPLYPHLVRWVSWVTHDYVIAGLIISIVAYGALGNVLYMYLRDVWNTSIAIWGFSLWLLYPTAFFYQAVYTESLFLLLTVSSLYALHKKRYLIASVCAFLASLTRLQGVLLVIPIVFTLYTSRRVRDVFVVGAPIAGLLVYMSYLYKTTGDALYFLTAQSSFGSQRSSELILFPQVIYRYVRIFLTADLSFAYGVAVLEFVFFTTVTALLGYIGYMSYKEKRMHELGIVLYSLAHMLLPTFTGTFSSIPRYSLCALALYSSFGMIPSYKLKVGILSIAGIMHVILIIIFIQGRFIS